MRALRRLSVVGITVIAAAACGATPLIAEEPPQTGPAPAEQPLTEPWLDAIPVPADPELERQITEVQEALGAIHKQMVRRKEALRASQDPAAKTRLYDEFEQLRKEREDLEALLHDLVDEATLSEQTAIDEALARARWLERQEERWYRKEELLRDRQ